MGTAASTGQAGSAEQGQPLQSAGEPLSAPSTRLLPFCFWLTRASATHPAGGSAGMGHQPLQPADPAVLSAAIAGHLAALGWSGAHPLRWAITAVDPLQGLQLEGVAVYDCAVAPDAHP